MPHAGEGSHIRLIAAVAVFLSLVGCADGSDSSGSSSTSNVLPPCPSVTGISEGSDTRMIRSYMAEHPSAIMDWLSPRPGVYDSLRVRAGAEAAAAELSRALAGRMQVYLGNFPYPGCATERPRFECAPVLRTDGAAAPNVDLVVRGEPRGVSPGTDPANLDGVPTGADVWIDAAVTNYSNDPVEILSWQTALRLPGDSMTAAVGSSLWSTPPMSTPAVQPQSPVAPGAASVVPFILSTTPCRRGTDGSVAVPPGEYSVDLVVVISRGGRQEIVRSTVPLRLSA